MVKGLLLSALWVSGGGGGGGASFAEGLLSIASSSSAGIRSAGGESYRQPLMNFKNVQYFGSLDVGGQTLLGIFDTGSFELLVRSTRCQWCLHPSPPYDHERSPSYRRNGTMATHTYGSGPCHSMKGYDTVRVGPFEARSQAFWEIVSHKMPILLTSRLAAIVGIGPRFAFGNQDSTLLMSFGISEFSVCLQRTSGAQGYLTWGSGVSSQYREQHYAQANVIGQYHWGTHLGSVSTKPRSLQSAQADPCVQGGCAVIIDSGTSLIAAPLEALKMLSQQIVPVKEDCSNMHELPMLHFEIDGTTISLPPEAYVLRVEGHVLAVDSIWDILYFKPKVRKVNTCVPAFMQLDMVSKFGPVWILGMPFFRYYHTTFDRQQQKMYFAEAGPDCHPQPFYHNGNATGTFFHAKDAGTWDSPLGMDLGAMVPPRLAREIDASSHSLEL